MQTILRSLSGKVVIMCLVESVERGPVRATIEVRREAAGSTFTQRIRLAAARAGECLEFDTLVDWRTPTTLLKATFPTTVSGQTATYDLGFGFIERPNNTEKKYEVPAQQWADLTDDEQPFGVTILNDCKYGWDKPDDHTLRLSLIHAPNDVEKDMGWHRFVYAVCTNRGDRGGVESLHHHQAIREAASLNQPLMAFQTTAHAGTLGRRFSFLNSGRSIVRALKKAENTDEIIVRLQEGVVRNRLQRCQIGKLKGSQSRSEVPDTRRLKSTLARGCHRVEKLLGKPIELGFAGRMLSER